MTNEEFEIQKELERNRADKKKCEEINEAEKIRFAEELKYSFDRELNQYEMYPTWVKKPLSMRIRERLQRLKIKLKNTF